MTQSGVSRLAAIVVDALGGLGDLGLLIGVLVATVLVTEIVTSNAAAVLMFPIALARANQAGLDPRPFAIAIALGASSSFLTPIGYQTNTMVYGMGGYRFSDFARVGFPLTLLMLLIGALVIPIAWPLK
jgi:di/tricarboxylate transporter